MVSEMLNIKVHRVLRNGKTGEVRARVDLHIGDLFLVKGFKVIENEKGTIVETPKGFIPLSDEVKQLLVDIVLEAYTDT